MSDTPPDHAWVTVAARLTEIAGRRCYVRLPRAAGWVVVPPDEWTEALLEGAIRLPIDGGGEKQGELVVPHAGGSDEVALVRPLLSELAETLLRLADTAETAEAALARERRLEAFGRA